MTTQSYASKELTHFVGRAEPNDEERYNLFVRILRGHWLRPTFPGDFIMQSDGGKPFSTNEAIKVKSLCFCDIPPTQLDVHMGKYRCFGIAFSKGFLLQRGIIPVAYVAGNARDVRAGRGPQTIGGRFNELRTDLQRFRSDLENYIFRIEGRPNFLSRLPAPNTPPGHQLLGRLSWLESEIEYLVFSRTKFFIEGLDEHHNDNFYMEREWRLPDGLWFEWTDIVRVILPRDYEHRFRDDLPGYTGEVLPIEKCLPSTPSLPSSSETSSSDTNS